MTTTNTDRKNPQTLNGKPLEKLTYVDWSALEQQREAERLRERMQDQIDYCRRRLDEAERHLKQTQHQFTHSAGILGSAGTELDMLAAQYSLAQAASARLVNALERDYLEANPDPAQGVVALLKFVRVEGCGLPALPEILVYNYRDPDRSRSQWAVTLGDRPEDVIAKGLGSRAQAEARAEREAKERGGLAFKVEVR